MNRDQALSALEFQESRLHSGIRHRFNKWEAFFFGIHCICLASTIAYSWVTASWPGADIRGVLLIAAALCLVHGWAFALIGGITPKLGADYYLASRTLPPSLSFISSWTLVVCSGVIAGNLAAWIPKTVMPALLQSMAIIFRSDSYQRLATAVSNATGTIIIGAAIVAVAALTVIRAHEYLRNILLIGFLLGLVTWAFIFYALGSTPGPDAFEAAWNRFMAHSSEFGVFSSRIPLAMRTGMQTTHGVLPMTFAGLIMGFWIYYGYHIPTFFSEEVQKPAKSLVFSSMGSILASAAIFTTGAILLLRLVSGDWLAAEGYLSNNADHVTEVVGHPVPTMPWITFYAAILNPSRLAIFVVAFGWMFMLVNLVQTYLFYTSRIVHSWTQDHVFPMWFRGDPFAPTQTRSVLLMSIFAVVGLLDAAFNGPLGTQLTFVFFAAVTQLVPICALLLLPKLKPELIQRLPRLARRRFLGLPVASWIAAITLAYLAWMIVASFLYPAVGVAHPRQTLTLLLVIMSSGTAWFYGRRWHRKRRYGRDLAVTYTNLDEGDDVELA